MKQTTNLLTILFISFAFSTLAQVPTDHLKISYDFDKTVILEYKTIKNIKVLKVSKQIIYANIRDYDEIDSVP